MVGRYEGGEVGGRLLHQAWAEGREGRGVQGVGASGVLEFWSSGVEASGEECGVD